MADQVPPSHGRAFAELRVVVGQAKGDDPLAPVVVIAPSNDAVHTVRQNLARHGVTPGRPGIAAVTVTNPLEYLESRATAAIGERRPVTNAVVGAAWRQVLADQPSVFDAVRSHSATVTALVNAHQELRWLTADELGALESHATSATTKDLIRLHRHVAEALEPHWYDERDLLDALAPEAGVPVVAFALDEIDPSVAGLMAKLDEAAITVDVPDENPTAGQVLCATDSDDEVRHVVRRVAAAIEDGVPAHRIAVLYTSPDPYEPLLCAHLTAAGLRFAGLRTGRLAHHGLARAILGLLRLPATPDPSTLFAMLSCSRAFDLSSPAGRIRVAAWESVARDAYVVRGLDWERRLTAFAPSEREAEARRAAKSSDAAALLAFVRELRRRLERADHAGTWQALADEVKALAADLFGLSDDASGAASPVWSAVAGELDAAKSLDGFTGDAPRRERLAEIIAERLDAPTGQAGKVGNGLLVAPVARAAGLDADLAFVIGLSEDLCPGNAGIDPLLPDSLRAIPEVARTPLHNRSKRLAATRRQVRAALGTAPKVVASFPRGDLRASTERLPSRYLMPTLRALSDDQGLAASDWNAAPITGVEVIASHAGSMADSPRPVTPSEHRVRAAVAGRVTDAVQAAALTLTAARSSAAFTRFDGNLTGVDGLRSAVTGDWVLSASSLESFAKCPHAWFTQKVLGVGPVEQPEKLDQAGPRDVGTAIHAAYERLVAEHRDAGTLPGPGEPWSAAAVERFVELGREQMQEIAARGMAGHPVRFARQVDQVTERLRTMLEQDDAWRREYNLAVVDSEFAFGTDGVPALMIDLGDDGSVAFRGSIDKVDRAADGTIVVTDIKTGGNTTYRGVGSFPQDRMPYGEKVKDIRVQLPLYAMAARQLLEAAEATVGATYWFPLDSEASAKTCHRGFWMTGESETDFRVLVATLAQAITEGVFPPLPGEHDPKFGGIGCPDCDPDGTGWVELREQITRKAGATHLQRLVRLIDPTLAQAAPPRIDDEDGDTDD